MAEQRRRRRAIRPMLHRIQAQRRRLMTAVLRAWRDVARSGCAAERLRAVEHWHQRTVQKMWRRWRAYTTHRRGRRENHRRGQELALEVAWIRVGGILDRWRKHCLSTRASAMAVQQRALNGWRRWFARRAVAAAAEHHMACWRALRLLSFWAKTAARKGAARRAAHHMTCWRTLRLLNFWANTAAEKGALRRAVLDFRQHAMRERAREGLRRWKERATYGSRMEVLVAQHRLRARELLLQRTLHHWAAPVFQRRLMRRIMTSWFAYAHPKAQWRNVVVDAQVHMFRWNACRVLRTWLAHAAAVRAQR